MVLYRYSREWERFKVRNKNVECFIGIEDFEVVGVLICIGELFFFRKLFWRCEKYRVEVLWGYKI